MPCNIAAAATSSGTPSGTGTVFAASITTCVACEPTPGTFAAATASPTARSSTPAPTATTRPANSSPRTNGVSIG